MNDVSHFGKGAVQTPRFIQDRHFRLAAAAVTPVDWSVPYLVPATLTQRNQDGSSSCTAQATSYYCEALDQIEHVKIERYSARFVYSQTNLGPNQGAYIYRAMAIPLKPGCASADSVPDKDSSEAIMLDKSDNAKGIIEARADKFAVIPWHTIDDLAAIIRDYHGFVTGFNGNNAMFAADGTVTNWSSTEWGHAVYCNWYGIRNGVKCIGFKNSWGSGWGTDGSGFFPEQFVKSGMLFDAYTYAAITDLDPSSMSYTLIRNPQKPDEVYALKGTTIRHISNFQTLQLGNTDPDRLWNWDGNGDSIKADPNFGTYVKAAELHLDPVE